MAFAEDLTVFFNSDEFAVEAVHTPAGGSAEPSVPVIFDHAADISEGVVATEPTFQVPAGTWPTLAPGSGMAIGGVSYRVRTITPIGDGAVLFVALAKV